MTKAMRGAGTRTAMIGAAAFQAPCLAGVRSGLRHLGAACLALAVVSLTVTVAATAQETPGTWAVTGVAPDDVLHLRDVPHGDSKILADIPPTARGLKGLGCITPEPSFDRWAGMTEAERANAKLEWCRVDYRGRQGWVAGRFLKPDR
jgi:hypothetical protein